MEKKKLKKKEVFLILLLVAFLVPIAYASFKNKFLGNGSIGLAKWDVVLNQTGVNNNLSIVPSPNEAVASYTVNIESVSEVSIVYSIVVDNLPTGVSVSLDGGTYVPESNHKAVLTTNGSIPYNDQTKIRNHTITFKASTTSQYVTDVAVDINVIAKQLV